MLMKTCPFPSPTASLAQMNTNLFYTRTGNPAALINVLMTASMFEKEGYTEAVRANLTAAGDNASRVIFIGALLAASVSEAPLLCVQHLVHPLPPVPLVS